MSGGRASDPWASLLERVRAATLGTYDIKGEIGRGGMAAVYLAHDLRLGRRVALKVMLPSLLYAEGMKERFEDEARTAAQLDHPHIVVIYSVSEVADLLCFAMKYIDGRSLDAVSRECGPMPLDVAQMILVQVAGALHYAHRMVVVHRDVKPANIMVDRRGNPVVTDFGIAKAAESPDLTQPGSIIGTPTYMSPEQWRGKKATAASDQYSLGIVAYEFLTGAPPFRGSAVEIQLAHVTEAPVPLMDRRPDCHPGVAAAIMRMLEKSPEARWPTLQDAIPALAVGLPGDLEPVRRSLVDFARIADVHPLASLPATPVSPLPRARTPLPEQATRLPETASPPSSPPSQPSAGTPPRILVRTPTPAAPTQVPPPPTVDSAPPTVVAPTPPSQPADAPTVFAPPASGAGAPPPRSQPPAVPTPSGSAYRATFGPRGELSTPAPSPQTPAQYAPAAQPAPPLVVTEESDAGPGLADRAAALFTGFARQAAAFSGELADRGGAFFVALPRWTWAIPIVAATAVLLVVTKPWQGTLRDMALRDSLLRDSLRQDSLRQDSLRQLALVEERRRDSIRQDSLRRDSLRRIDSLNETLDPRTPAEVKITPPRSTSIAVNERLQLRAYVHDANGRELGSRGLAWTSSDERVATVSQTGVVRGQSSGRVTIWARAADAVEGVELTIRAPVIVGEPASLVVADVAPLDVGDSMRLRAVVRDAGGATLNAPVYWSSSRPEVASVGEESGVVRAQAVGTTTITATAGGVTSQRTVTVVRKEVEQPPPPPSGGARTAAQLQAEAEALIRDYGRAIESGSIARIRSVHTTVSEREERGWSALFANASDISVRFERVEPLQPPLVDAVGEQEQFRALRTVSFTNRSSRRGEKHTFEVRLTLVRQTQGWRLLNISEERRIP